MLKISAKVILIFGLNCPERQLAYTGGFSTKANIARECIYRFKENNLINSAGFP